IDENAAVAVCAPPTVTLQVLAVPLHTPPQPLNCEPLAGVAVSVTWLPGVKLSLQTLPQSMSLGELVTLPLPVLLIVRLVMSRWRPNHAYQDWTLPPDSRASPVAIQL